MQPIVPGFAITGEPGSSATGSTWAAVRQDDDRSFVVKIVPVTDIAEARSLTTHLIDVLRTINSEHLVAPHDAVALADGTLALVLDEVTGGTLAHLLAARGQLTPGETVTAVAPLFGALADLHAAGVVHGDLEPANLLFSGDGRPLISDIGVGELLGRPADPNDGASGLVAPELLGGAERSPASDVYAMAAIGWLCLTGARPTAAGSPPSVTAVRPEAPHRLIEVLSSCLSTNPAARPSAGTAAVEVFEAASAEPVALALVPDPAVEITRRIRADAVPVPPASTPPSPAKPHRPALVIGILALVVAALIVAATLAGGSSLFLGRTPTAQPVGVSVVAPESTPPTAPRSITAAVTSPLSRVAATALLQALVDARALAYVARNPALLDLVYAPGAGKAAVDESNISTALKNGATYIGLAFEVKEAAFLGGTSSTSRIRASIVTPAYETGQPDGRRVAHAQEIVGPSVFTLARVADGWRIVSLTASPSLP